jgi:chitinase
VNLVRGGAFGTKLWSEMVASGRKQWIDSLIKFMQDYGFDGVDLYWEFPQTKADTENFALLATKIKREFNAKGRSGVGID